MKVPKWAHHLFPDQWDEFRRLVELAVGSHSIAVSIDWANGTILLSEIGLVGRLDALYELWLCSNPSEFERRTFWFIDGLLNGHVYGRTGSAEFVSALLPRVYALDSISAYIIDDLAVKMLSPLTVSVLVTDSREGVECVSKSRLLQEGVSVIDAWNHAMANLYRVKGLRFEKYRDRYIGNGVWGQHDYYGASLILRLPEIVERIKETTVLAIVPHRGVTLWSEVNERREPKVRDGLADSANYLSSRTPFAISREVFAWRNGELESLGVFAPDL